MTEQVCQPERVGVYPGSFDPPTIAHLAIAVLARRAADLDRVDLVISRAALAKPAADDADFERRLNVVRASIAHAPWLSLVITELRLIADIAADYDAVIMGGDKWAQLQDPVFYGGSNSARDQALARLPQVVGPNRPGSPPLPDSAIQVELPDRLLAVSSTAARSTNPEWMTPAARRAAQDAGIWGYG